MRRDLEGGLAWLKASMEGREMSNKIYKEHKRKKQKMSMTQMRATLSCNMLL